MTNPSIVDLPLGNHGAWAGLSEAQRRGLGLRLRESLEHLGQAARAYEAGCVPATGQAPASRVPRGPGAAPREPGGEPGAMAA